jgi:hypothetical protein
MTYVGFRDHIDDFHEKITTKRKELGAIKANEKKKAKEEATQRSDSSFLPSDGKTNVV